jgi:N-acetylglucosamine-6-phosphate deacetylase
MDTGMEWAGRHWLTGERVLVLTAEGRIRSVAAASGSNGEEGEAWIAPGLIDLQVNGIHGIDFNDPSITNDCIRRAVMYLHSIGVIRFCPTIVTNDKAAMLASMRRIAEACESDGTVARAVIGIHVEGPFLSGVAGARGAHAEKHMRDPDWHEYLRWEEASGGRIAMVTLAPERRGAVGLIRKLKARGVVVAIGHTDAGEEHIREAVEAGATMSTHLGNGTRPMLKRHPNFIWEQLAEDRLWAGFIADGHHLPRSTLKAMIRAKRNKSILVSDANHYEGCAPGRYWKRNHHEVVLRPDGRLYMAEAPDILSGAALGLHKGVENVVKFGIGSWAEAIAMASLHPAELMGMSGTGDGLTPGADADFIRYRASPDHELEIVETVVGGKTVFAKRGHVSSDSKR